MAPPAARKPRKPAALDPVELLKLAAAGQAPPLLLVTGQDIFSRDAILEQLRTALVAEGFEGFDVAVVAGEETTGDRLINLAEALPMGGVAGGSRFILVRRAEKLKERDLEALEGYAGSPTPSSCVTLVFGPTKATTITGLKKLAPVLDFPAPRDYQLARWLEAQAKRLKIQLDADGARALAELAGEDFVAAMSELDRTALNANGARITRRMVEEQAGAGRDTNVFHFADALLGAEPARAVKILRDLGETGESGYMILGMLEGQLRRFLKMRAAMREGSEGGGGRTARSVVQAASPMLPPAIQARLARQLESFDEDRLIAAFRAARVADRSIKSHGSGAELAHIESLIWGIAGLNPTSGDRKK
ncbi:MAG TPA: DNA polymerase III subunit delta [Patescibacteria group bacterium]|nr:DNA polymerase III subunit delta [Patescibacteria group bacterium]